MHTFLVDVKAYGGLVEELGCKVMYSGVCEEWIGKNGQYTLVFVVTAHDGQR